MQWVFIVQQVLIMPMQWVFTVQRVLIMPMQLAVSYANASAAYSVALGSLSVADREAGMAGYDPVTGDKSADESSVWKANAGAVSIGSSADGEEITRQITNVAAGTEDTCKRSSVEEYQPTH